MESYPVLPSLISQYIRVKIFGEPVYDLPFESIENTMLGTTLSLDPPSTTAFTARFKNGLLSDGYYSVKANVSSDLEFPSECMVVVLHWTLEVENDIQLTVMKASVVSTLFSQFSSTLCKVTQNYEVARLRHCLQFKSMLTDEPFKVVEAKSGLKEAAEYKPCLLYTSPSPRDS